MIALGTSHTYYLTYEISFFIRKQETISYYSEIVNRSRIAIIIRHANRHVVMHIIIRLSSSGVYINKIMKVNKKEIDLDYNKELADGVVLDLY